MDAVEQLALGLRLTRGAIVSTYALVLYEFLIMLDREYKAIYKSPWSLSKCLYLTCRFGLLLCWPVVMYAFLSDHDMESCKPFLIIVSVIFILLTTNLNQPCSPQCLFVLRAYAITGAKRWTLFIYLPCLFGYLFIVCWHTLNEMALWKEAFLILGRTACFRALYDRYGSYFRMLLAAMALDGVIGLMLVVHFIRLRGPQTRLANLLTTQGILYFPVMFLLNAGATVAIAVGAPGYDALSLSAIVVISNIMACRFVVQIKEYASNDPDSPEMLSRVRREVERAFPVARRSSAETDSLGLSNIEMVSKV